MCRNRHTVLALVLGIMCSTGLAAQSSNAPSFTEGLLLNIHFGGVTISFDEDNQNTQAGGGGGIAVGYGFSPLFAVVMNVDAAVADSDDLADPYALTHVDLLGRFHFGSGSRVLVPFLEAGFNGRAGAIRNEGLELSIQGGGLTLGGGMKYFVSTGLSLDLVADASIGSFTTASLKGGGASIDVDVDIAAVSGRLAFGLTWYPGAK